MVDKVALGTGARGMDFAHLSRLLLDKGYVVYGMSRRTSAPNFWRLETLGIMDKVRHVDGDLTDQESLYRIMTKIKQDHPGSIVEIYNLGANSFVGNSWSQPCVHLNINTVGACNVMTAALRVFGVDRCKIYMAGSSEQFGQVLETPQTESTPFNPRSPYGVSKAAMHYLAKNFRDSYGMFVCVGILFNHTGPLRGDEFVEQKIIRSLVERFMLFAPFELGNLEAKRDYGHSEDYMNAAYLMLQHSIPNDYVVATGETHTIESVILKAVDAMPHMNSAFLFFTDRGTDSWKLWDKSVGYYSNLVAKCNKEFYRPAEVDLLIGDPQNIKNILGWEPKYTFDDIIKEMVTSAIKRHENGEHLQYKKIEMEILK